MQLRAEHRSQHLRGSLCAGVRSCSPVLMPPSAALQTARLRGLAVGAAGASSAGIGPQPGKQSLRDTRLRPRGARPHGTEEYRHMSNQKRMARTIISTLWAAVLLVAVGGGQARAQLPADWKSEDIGTAKDNPGSIDVTNGVYTIKGSGNDVWGTADGFRFTYKALQGDGSIIARVLELPSLPNDLAGTASSAKAGVMIRET